MLLTVVNNIQTLLSFFFSFLSLEKKWKVQKGKRKTDPNDVATKCLLLVVARIIGIFLIFARVVRPLLTIGFWVFFFLTLFA